MVGVHDAVIMAVGTPRASITRRLEPRSAGRTRPAGGPYSISRRRSASATAAVRSDAPSFSKMCSRWVFTVSGEM